MPLTVKLKQNLAMQTV